MDATWALLVVGLPVGAMYGLAALGLVLVHRTTGILNLAQGAVATAAAFAFHQLRSQHDVPAAVAVAGGLAVAAALGLLSSVVHARIGPGRPLAQAVASLGVAGLVLAGCAQLFGTEIVFAAPFYPHVQVTVAGTALSGHQLLVLGAALATTAAGAVVLFRTWVGLALRGMADERTAASLAGIAVPRFEALAIAAGSVLAGVAGILLAPLLFLDTGGLGVFFLLKPLAAAVAAGLTSLTGALAAGLAIGAAESVLTRVAGVPGLPELVPLVVVVAALALTPGKRVDSLPWPPLATGPARRPGFGRRWPAWLLVAALVVAVPHLTLYQATIVQLAAVTALLAGSHVVVTGWVGQLSLAQPALTGIGAIVTAGLATRLDVPFPGPLLVGPLAAVPAAALVGLAALRSRALLLAAVTLAFSAASAAILFAWKPFAGGVEARTLPPPALAGFDLSGHRFTSVAVLAAAGGFAVLRRLARSRWGAGMVAVREHERAAAALGVPAGVAKLIAFAAAGWVCGLAGSLSAYQLQTVSVDQYHPLTALPVLAAAVVGGVESLWGAVLGGALHVFAPEALRALSAEAITATLTPLALLAVLSFRPGGLASLARRRRDPADLLDEDAPASPGEHATHRRGPRPALAVSGLEVCYGSFLALDRFDLAVAPGEIVALIGPNGSGKTSVFEAISGFVASTGRVELDGRPLHGLPPHRRARSGLARTFQGGGLFPRLSVADNLDIARSWGAGGTPPPSAVLAAAGLSCRAGVTAADLPHGTARLVEVARAMCLSPRVVLLDEPAAGLAPGETAALMDALCLVRDLCGLAILLVEHDPRVVDRVDRVVVIDQGHLLATGQVDEIRRDPAVAAVYLGVPARSDRVAPASAGRETGG